MIDRDTLTRALSTTLDHTSLDALGHKYEGKVRDNYTTADGRRYIVVTDRISAFDRVIGTLPLKGQVLNRLAAYWFEQTRDVAPNHVIRMPDPNVLEAHECTPLPVEMVMRAYVTGVTSTSIWTHYARGERVFCGHRLPDGLRKNERLPAPILTPSTKAPKGDHDVSASREEILAMGHIAARRLRRRGRRSRARSSPSGSSCCAERGLILVDTKYEFGKDARRRHRRHRRDPHARLVALLVHAARTPSASPRARIRSRSTRSTCAAGSRAWASRATARSPTIPDEVRVEAARRYIEAFETITGDGVRARPRGSGGAHAAQPRPHRFLTVVLCGFAEAAAAGRSPRAAARPRWPAAPRSRRRRAPRPTAPPRRRHPRVDSSPAARRSFSTSRGARNERQADHQQQQPERDDDQRRVALVASARAPA